MAIKERIKAFIEHEGISTTQFEKKCGLAKGFVKNIVNTISVDKMQNILSAFPELNANWLISGEGKMIHEKSDILALAEEAQKYLRGEGSGFAQFFAPHLIDSRRDVRATGNGLAVGGDLNIDGTKKIEAAETIEEVNTDDCPKYLEREVERLLKEVKHLNAEIKRLEATVEAKNETISTQKQLIKHLTKK